MGAAACLTQLCGSVTLSRQRCRRDRQRATRMDIQRENGSAAGVSSSCTAQARQIHRWGSAVPCKQEGRERECACLPACLPSRLLHGYSQRLPWMAPDSGSHPSMPKLSSTLILRWHQQSRMQGVKDRGACNAGQPPFPGDVHHLAAEAGRATQPWLPHQLTSRACAHFAPHDKKIYLGGQEYKSEEPRWGGRERAAS